MPRAAIARRVRRLSLGLLLLVALVATSGIARAGESRRNLDLANADLLAEPPRRDEGRVALLAAITAADEPEAVAEAEFLLGRLDEEDGNYAQAMLDDRSCIVAARQSRWAVRASDRIDWLRARSEDDFAPLRRLESIRHDPALSSNPATLESLAHEADGFPPGWCASRPACSWPTRGSEGCTGLRMRSRSCAW